MKSAANPLLGYTADTVGETMIDTVADAAQGGKITQGSVVTSLVFNAVTEGVSSNAFKNSEDRLKLDLQHFAKKADISSNFKKVDIDPQKIMNYALNPNHPVGGNKAKVFESALGYNQNNADDLINQIKKNVSSYDAVAGITDQYGTRYSVDMNILGANGKTEVVRTGWILDNGSDTSRLTTLFVK